MNVRRSIAAATVLVAVPVLASCGVNFGAQTIQPYNPAAGVDDREGQVDVLNSLVVSGSDGSGTVVAGLVNNDPDRDDTLKNVTGENLTVQVGGPTTIPAGGLLNLAEEGGVQASGDAIVPGHFVRLTFSFDHARAITVSVPVVSHSNPDYADVPLP